MIVVPFIPAHLNGLVVHQWMGHMNGLLTEEYGEMLSQFPSYSAIVDGEVVAIFGVYPLSETMYSSWGLVTEKSARYMLPITREVNKFFELFKASRVEAHVRADFEKGMRWMGLIGFDLETPKPQRKWGDDGHDYYQYARVI